MTRLSPFIALSTMLIGLIATPAFATKTRDAIIMCEGNPKCEYVLRGKWVDITTADGDIIMCPSTGGGDCVCATCAQPKRTAGKQVAPDLRKLLTR